MWVVLHLQPLNVHWVLKTEDGRKAEISIRETKIEAFKNGHFPTVLSKRSRMCKGKCLTWLPPHFLRKEQWRRTILGSNTGQPQWILQMPTSQESKCLKWIITFLRLLAFRFPSATSFQGFSRDSHGHPCTFSLHTENCLHLSYLGTYWDSAKCLMHNRAAWRWNAPRFPPSCRVSRKATLHVSYDKVSVVIMFTQHCFLFHDLPGALWRPVKKPHSLMCRSIKDQTSVKQLWKKNLQWVMSHLHELPTTLVFSQSRQQVTVLGLSWWGWFPWLPRPVPLISIRASCVHTDRWHHHLSNSIETNALTASSLSWTPKCRPSQTVGTCWHPMLNVPTNPQIHSRVMNSVSAHFIYHL